MMKTNCSPQIETKTLTGSLFRRQETLMRYDLGFPQITGKPQGPSIVQINRFYLSRAQNSLRKIKSDYWREACAQCDALGLTDSFQPLSVTCTPTVMYNDRGLISVFSDTYIDLGPAGRALKRQAETWVLRFGQMVPLGWFFRPGVRWIPAVQGILTEEIRRQASAEPTAYYADWPRRVPAEFRQERFYLADDGFTVFYPECALTGKSGGIPSFLIPYQRLSGALGMAL